jgi:hypothetical protein
LDHLGRKVTLRLAIRLLVPLSILVASCESPGQPVKQGSGASDFVVVAGMDGVALVGADWIERVPDLGAPGFSGGQLSAELDRASAAVLSTGHIAIVRPHDHARVADCADCAGIAVTERSIVTTRKNFTPDNGFDIVTFKRDLKPDRVVPAQRLEERVTTDFPAENTESPVTLAADANRVTVGYLSRGGGVRAGPSVIAQYDFDGNLLGSTMVDGILGESLVSPDGRYLALGVGGSAGACVTISAPAVVDLQSLKVHKIEPEVPGPVDSGAYTWFMLTDLSWQQNMLSATGQAHDPPPSESCDPDPQEWRRTFDPTTGTVKDATGDDARPTRWVGPGCDDSIAFTWDGDTLLRHARGAQARLGRYTTLGPGRARPQECHG